MHRCFEVCSTCDCHGTLVYFSPNLVRIGGGLLPKTFLLLWSMTLPTLDLGSCLADIAMANPHPNEPSNTLLHECASTPNPPDLIVASEPDVCALSNGGKRAAIGDSVAR